MADDRAPETADEWTLDDWTSALTLRVGQAYACRACGNLVMVTKGGVGVLDLECCGKPMEEVRRGPDAEAQA